MSYHNELERLGIDLKGRTSGKLKAVCPRCSERKGGTRDKDLSVNIGEGLYKCHSSNCDFKGYAKTTSYSRPEWNPNTTALSNKLVREFEDRGISQATLKKLNIGEGSRGEIVFNYFRDGQLVNTKTKWVKNGKKAFSQHEGSEKILYNLDSLKGKTKCIFVEGEMDVLSWVEAGVSSEYGIVSVDMGAPQPGTNTDRKLQCITNCSLELDGIKEFYICTDKDAPGFYLEQILIRRMGEHRCNIIPLPKGAKDSNDLLIGDQDISVKSAALKLQLAKAKPVPVPGIHTLSETVRERMIDQFHNGRQKGGTTHFPDIDERFTFLPGELTAVTGIPGHGKGQGTRQLMIMKAKYDGWKWAIYAPEDHPVDVFFDDIVHTYVGMSPYKEHDNQMSEGQYNEAMNWAKDHFILIYPERDPKTGTIDLPTNSWLNEKIRFLKLKYGVNAYVKDPWNKIYHDFRDREDQYLAKELSKEKFFAEGYDAAFYIAHPRTMRQQNGKYVHPTAYDISGGANWYNMADNIIVWHRPNIQDDPTDKVTEFRSLKIKKQKLVGKPGRVDLYFEVKENRYYQMGGSDFNPLSKGLLSKMNDDEDIPF